MTRKHNFQYENKGRECPQLCVDGEPCPAGNVECNVDGGRESGNPGSVGGAESTRAAAANPAACPMCAAPNPGMEIHFIDEHGMTTPEAHGLFEALRKDERIRELEAEAAMWKKAAQEGDDARVRILAARVKELETDAKECMRAQTLAVRERPPRKGEECGG